MKYFFQSDLPTLSRELYDLYDSFKINGIKSSRFNQAEMSSWLRPFDENKLFNKTVLGRSSEGRFISLYSVGNGPTKAMLWSQMHGDEPTATMALADILSFFARYPEHKISKTISENLTLLLIPMLNPDGAQRYTRRTAQFIDMNRDALATETPEAKILKEARDKYRPEYGFNLHDQDPRLTVGTTKNVSAIALLAPAADHSRADNSVRIRAKKVASTFAQVLNQFIPGKIAKWDDTFEPRAFGDNFQKWGTSTLLVESGGWQGDRNKFFIRELNCVALLVSLYAIALGESENADTEVYENIPFNTKLGCDRIIRNALLKTNGQSDPIRIDIAMNIDERINSKTGGLEEYATIVDIGDLGNFIALAEEVDARGALFDSDRFILDKPFSLSEVPFLLSRA
jgi:hypothetical protein